MKTFASKERHRFAAALGETLEKNQIRQKTFAGKIGSSPALVSVWISGKETVYLDRLADIIGFFTKPEVRTDLVAAYYAEYRELPPPFDLGLTLRDVRNLPRHLSSLPTEWMVQTMLYLLRENQAPRRLRYFAWREIVLLCIRLTMFDHAREHAIAMRREAEADGSPYRTIEAESLVILARSHAPGAKFGRLYSELSALLERAESLEKDAPDDRKHRWSHLVGILNRDLVLMGEAAFRNGVVIPVSSEKIIGHGQAALRLARDDRERAHALEVTARAHTTLGQSEQALQHLDEIREIGIGHGRETRTKMALTKARNYLSAGHREKAVRLLLATRDQCTELRDLSRQRAASALLTELDEG